MVFAGAESPCSPIHVNVQPHLDVGGIRVQGLSNSEILVDYSVPWRVVLLHMYEWLRVFISCFWGVTDLLMSMPFSFLLIN